MLEGLKCSSSLLSQFLSQEDVDRGGLALEVIQPEGFLGVFRICGPRPFVAKEHPVIKQRHVGQVLRIGWDSSS